MKDEGKYRFRDNYNEYMNSSLWFYNRRQQIHDDKYTCQICESRNELQVHHLTYERMGHERDGDLQTVCSRCHNDIHFFNKRIPADVKNILQQIPITETEYRQADELIKAKG